MSEIVPVAGGCLCGAVRFEALSEAEPNMLDCNCSICSASGYLHLFIPHDRFTLVSGREYLTSYRFGIGQAEHLFCKICGVKSFYQPKSHPDCWSVHLKCLDDASELSPMIQPFDGRDWEKANIDRGLQWS